MTENSNANLSPNEMIYVFTSYHISRLEGEALTLIDASTSDLVQRKALKDLFRQMIWEWATGSNREAAYELKLREGSSA